jgi:DNA primase
MTLEDMEATLNTLGIQVIGTRGVEVQAACPAHEERTGHADRNPSWYINSESGAHICFSCGFKGNIHSLISYMKGIPLDQATEFASTRLNLTDRMLRLLNPVEAKEEEKVIVTESMLSAFVDVPDEALKARGLTREAANTYRIRWDRHKNNWIIPVRHVYGHLLGWQEKGFTNRYFNNHPKGMKKGHSLFGYDQYSSGDMVVVESPLDVVRLASIGIPGGVATYGCSISIDQLSAIRGADRIIFAMDNDEAGRSASRDLFQRCRELKTEAWFFNYGNIDVKDVGAMSRPEVISGLNTAKHMLRLEGTLR